MCMTIERTTRSAPATQPSLPSATWITLMLQIQAFLGSRPDRLWKCMTLQRRCVARLQGDHLSAVPLCKDVIRDASVSLLLMNFDGGVSKPPIDRRCKDDDEALIPKPGVSDSE